MEHPSPDNRKELRYALDTQAILERNTGEQFSAATINVSGSGMLVQLEQAPGLRLGEVVNCSVLLYQGKPLQSWGLGTVVRVEDLRVAIEFKNVRLLAADFE
jgi:PilZ domain